MSKLLRSHQGKEKIGFWLLNPASKIENLLLTLFFLLLPTQFGKHFWPDFTIVSGIRIDYLSPTLYVTDVMLILLFGIFLIRQIKFFRISKIKFHTVIFVLFLLFIACNVFFSARPLLSLYGVIKFLELAFLVFYLASVVRQKLQLQYISLLFGASSLFESLLAIFQYLNQGSLNGIFYYFGERGLTGATPGIANASLAGTLVLRPYATFPHPNVLAGYLLVGMVLVWHFALPVNNKWMRIFSAITLLVSSIALLLTFGRIAIFLWGVFVVFVLGRILLQSIKSNQVKRAAGVVTIVSLVIIGVLSITHNVIVRFSQTSLFEESVVERTELLFVSEKMIQQHPLFGVGLDNFIPAMAPLQKPMPLGLYLQPVHNIFVLLTVETGLVGLGFFLWLLLATFLRSKKQEAGIRSVFYLLLFIIFVTGMFDHYWLTLQQGQLLFATILGLSWAKLQK